MKTNINSKELENNIDNNSTINKPASGVNPSVTNSGTNNVIRDLSKNTTDKSWFKKKSSIIGMSSTLGAVVLTTAIAVPVALTTSATSRPQAEISGVVSVFDLAKTSTKLVISGTNLPEEISMYTVTNVTTTRVNSNFNIGPITLTSGPKNPDKPGIYDIYLDFLDSSLAPTTIYQVSLKDGNVVTSKSDQNVKQPMLDIATQPKDYTIPITSKDNVVTLSIAISAITNPITGEVATYQWQSSDVLPILESNWTDIVGATNTEYQYNPGTDGLFEGDKKYFRCIVNYKYVKPIASFAGFVMIVSKPTISITNQPMSVNLPFTGTTATLTVDATVINNDTASLTYQWQQSTSEKPSGPYENISGETNKSYTFSNAASIISGTKKYFKCIVSSAGLESLDSNVIYIGRNSQPILTFTKQIGDADLTFNTTSKELSVNVSIDIPIDGITLTYQWYKSTTNTNSSTWTKITGATARTYTANGFTADVREYFKCEVTYNSGNTITSDIGSVIRLTPVISFTKEIGEINILNDTNPNVTLSVEATIANRTDSNAPTYKWYQYDAASESGGTVIANETSSSFTYNGSSLGLNASKFFRCEVSYPNAISKYSAFGSVSKKPSWILIETQPTNQMIPISAATATVSVGAVIMHGNNANLSYKWQKSTSNPGADGTGANWTDINGATGASYTASIGSTDTDRMKWPNTWYRCVLTASGISGTASTNPVFIKVGLSTSQATSELGKWFTANKQQEQSIIESYFTNITSAQRYEFYRYVKDGRFESIPDTAFVSATPITINVQGAPSFDTYKIRLKTIGTKQTVYTNQETNKGASFNVGIKIEFVLLFSLRGNVQLVRERTSNNFVLDFSPKFSTSGDVNKTSLAWTYDSANAPVYGYHLKPNAYSMQIISEVDNSTTVYLDNYLIDFSCPNADSINNTKYTTIPTYNSLV